MKPDVLASKYYINSDEVGGSNKTFKDSFTIERETSKTLTQSQTHTVGFSLSVSVSAEVGLPILAEASMEMRSEFSYSYANMKSKSTSEKEAWKFSWEMASTSEGLAPQTAAYCKATATMGTFSSDYDAKITAKLANGKDFKYNSRGRYDSVGFARGIQNCETIPLSEVPSEASKEEGTSKKEAKRSTRLDRFINQA